MAIPLRWAYLPILIAAAHTPHFEALIGFSTVRLVIVTGLLRAVALGKIKWSARHPIDILFLIWSIFAILSGFAHSWEYNNPFIYRSGLIVSVFGTYLYTKAYLNTPDALKKFAQATVIVLAPSACMMVIETVTGRNPYYIVGSWNALALVREGRTRAAGPFGTPILAGTVAALCVPLLLPLWKSERKTAVIGLLACLTIIGTSASSTPIGTLLVGLFTVWLWKFRRHLKLINWGTIILLVVLHLIKERPVWYLISLVDFVGGSTGYHRAKLIDSAITYIGDWWLAGTDYTIPWMPYALASTPGHVDLTSYYIFLGVVGGLPLMLTTIVIIYRSFSILGKRLNLRGPMKNHSFLLWCAGSTLFAHVITILTVSYFDNSYVFFFMLIGVIATLWPPPRVTEGSPEPQPA